MTQTFDLVIACSNILDVSKLNNLSARRYFSSMQPFEIVTSLDLEGRTYIIIRHSTKVRREVYIERVGDPISHQCVRKS